MSFPKKGDFLLFEEKFMLNLGDLGQGNIYIEIPKNTTVEVLDTYIPKQDTNSPFIDYALFIVYLGVDDKNIAPEKFVIKFNYIEHQHKVKVIPGGNPKTVEVLFGKNEM